MLKEDKTSGSLTDKRVVFRIRDAATFTGELCHIAGTATDVKVRINTDAYGVVFCITTKEIAKALRDFLFEDVRVSGRGTWIRCADGPWWIEDFSITDYAPVNRESLRGAVDRLRAIGIDWPNDPLGEIMRINEAGGSGFLQAIRR